MGSPDNTSFQFDSVSLYGYGFSGTSGIERAAIDGVEVAPALGEFAGAFSCVEPYRQKEFLSLLVQRIMVSKSERQERGNISGMILPLSRRNGSPGRTRTCNLVVNSHPLCRLSYRGICENSKHQIPISK